MSVAYRAGALGRGAEPAEAGTTYRYLLWREWDPLLQPRPYHLGTCLFIMCNPSTASGLEDDPTIRRCVGFARMWGFKRLEVVNLWAARATKPQALRRIADPVGPDNDVHLEAALSQAEWVAAAWGTLSNVPASLLRRDRPGEVLRRVTARAPLHALSVTSGGAPAHPLYLPRQCQPCVWRPRASEVLP